MRARVRGPDRTGPEGISRQRSSSSVTCINVFKLTRYAPASEHRIMNRSDVDAVLKLRYDLTGTFVQQRDYDSVADAWVEALADVPQSEAIRALRDLVANGEKHIAVPEIKRWLRERTALAKRAEFMGEAERDNKTDKPIRFASMQPDAITARRQWWSSDRAGHYPGCHCPTCLIKITTEEAPC